MVLYFRIIGGRQYWQICQGIDRRSILHSSLLRSSLFASCRYLIGMRPQAMFRMHTQCTQESSACIRYEIPGNG